MPCTATVHAVTTIGIDMGENTLHMIGLDSRGARISTMARSSKAPSIGRTQKRKTNFSKSLQVCPQPSAYAGDTLLGIRLGRGRDCAAS